MPKIFIYNAEGCSPESIADMKTLLIEGKVVPGADIAETDCNFNMAGLPRHNEVTLVVPGGSSTVIGRQLKNVIKSFKTELGTEFNYLGICAGAYLGVANAYILYARHTNMDKTHIQAVATFDDFEAKCDVTTEGLAIGPFYPNTSYAQNAQIAKAKNCTLPPYAVQLTSSATKRMSSHLYVAGCGFVLAADQQQFETVACYTDKPSYSFCYPKEQQHTIENFPAIIRRKSTADKKVGGIFLSGPHIEANVKESQLLRFFAPLHWQEGKGITFNQEAYGSIAQSAETNVAEMTELLRETFNP